jgi:glycerol-3-phosphate dehydrogenase subunit B
VREVLVVGAGAAGTAAALVAARPGVRVTVVDGGTGASTLATGAVDALPWQDPGAEPTCVDPSAREVLDRLGSHVVPQDGAMLLSTSGIARPAAGHDAALLDVRALAKKPIGVVCCDRPGWDGAALGRAWGRNYTPLEAVVVRHVGERVLPDADFAMRHDDESRLGWLADRLREAMARSGRQVAALVLPPCLGVERARARQLSELVGVPCGEPIAAPGGPSGLRFERARDRALAAALVERRSSRVERIVKHEDGWDVVLEDGTVSSSDEVVLAMGGLIGGGIEYCPAESVAASAVPPSPRLPFRLTIDAPATLGAYGQALGVPSTLFGAEPESIAWPFVRDGLMQRVGVLVDPEGRSAQGLLIAGDLRADRPRTWLDSFATGLAAGAAATLGGVVSATSRSPSPDEGPPIRP